LVPRFTEHKVNQCTWHHVDARPVTLASAYMSLDEVDWNIMVPAKVNQTWTGTIVANFHETVEMSHKVRTADTFSDYIATLPEHICQLLMHYEFTPGVKEPWKLVSNETCYWNWGPTDPTIWEKKQHHLDECW
jgi:hypothetical protein